MTELTPFDEGYIAPEPAPKAERDPPKAIPTPKAKSAPRAAASAAPSKPRVYSAEERDQDGPPEVTYPTAIADGIYFGMIDDAYHAIHRLSASGMQAMTVSPATFWAGSWLNPNRVDRPTVARMIGRAYHTARLEPDLFPRSYVRALDKSEMPKGTLFTGSEMGAALEEMGLKKTGSVSEQARRLIDGGYEGTVWYSELAQWENDRGERSGIPAVTFDEIVADGERLRSSPKIAELLSGGVAEVSVFWTCPKTGIPMKARLDYLKARAWADLKTFDNSRGKVLAQAIADAFRYNRYYMQAVAYRDAVEAIRNGLVDIVGDASEAARDIIAEIQLSPAPLACWYVFQEKGGVPNIVARRFKFDDLPLSHSINRAGLDEHLEAKAAAAVGRSTQISTKARLEIEHAKHLYLGYSEIYEPGEPWLPIEPMDEIGDESFSAYWLEGRSE